MTKREKWLRRGAQCLGGMMLTDTWFFVILMSMEVEVYYLVGIMVFLLALPTALLLLLALSMRGVLRLRYPAALKRLAKPFGRGAALAALMIAVAFALGRLEQALFPWKLY